ncbi:MAG: helix-turn-helix domain-containing protein [Opitutales bacterium]|nr:helix-turn-helix domain-containing protein [Opitutales bacterium]
MNMFAGIERFSWGIITYKAHSRFGPRRQRNYQLVFVHSGEARVFAGGLEAVVGPGEWALLYPGRREVFRFSRKEPTRHSWIHAEPAHASGDSMNPGDTWLASSADTIPVGRMTERMHFIINDLLQSGAPADGPARERCGSLAAAAFFDAFEQTGTHPRSKGGGPSIHPCVERALSLIRSRFAGPLDLRTIARHAGGSPQHLARLFKEQIGRTPVRHLWRTREDEAARLLRESGLTVAEIAEACGFQNAFHFSRRMRERFGAPPKTLRADHWEKSEAVR